MISSSCKSLKSDRKSFTHGVGILNHQFQTTPNILSMTFRVRQTIVVVQVHLGYYKVFKKMSVQNVFTWY